tara:strand:+ start:6092 stop:6730 length:639 start_codon:yes stop_codon:yes gene_type:complete
MPEIPHSIKVEILRYLNVEELLDVTFTSKIYLEISKFIFNKDYDDFKLIISVKSLYYFSLLTKYLSCNYKLLHDKIKSESDNYQISNKYINYISEKNIENEEMNVFFKLLGLYKLKSNEGSSYCSFYIWDERYEIQNSNNNVYNILNKYLGMGWDYALINIKGTNDYFCDFLGGSNDYDRHDNLSKIQNLNFNNVTKFTLVDAFDKFMKYES